jgi:hypothetical protein
MRLLNYRWYLVFSLKNYKNCGSIILCFVLEN